MEELGVNTFTFPSVAKPHLSLTLPLIPREIGWNTNRHRFSLALISASKNLLHMMNVFLQHHLVSSFIHRPSSSTPLYNYWPCICLIPLLSESLLPNTHSARAVPAQGTNGFQEPVQDPSASFGTVSTTFASWNPFSPPLTSEIISWFFFTLFDKFSYSSSSP